MHLYKTFIKLLLIETETERERERERERKRERKEGRRREGGRKGKKRKKKLKTTNIATIRQVVLIISYSDNRIHSLKIMIIKPKGNLENDCNHCKQIQNVMYSI
jgi:hypothetical protein